MGAYDTGGFQRFPSISGFDISTVYCGRIPREKDNGRSPCRNCFTVGAPRECFLVWELHKRRTMEVLHVGIAFFCGSSTRMLLFFEWLTFTGSRYNFLLWWTSTRFLSGRLTPPLDRGTIFIVVDFPGEVRVQGS